MIPSQMMLSILRKCLSLLGFYDIFDHSPVLTSITLYYRHLKWVMVFIFTLQPCYIALFVTECV